MKKLILFLLLIPILGFSQKRDSLVIKFPEKYHLTLKNNRENAQQIFREWIPENQTWENYDIIFTQSIIKEGEFVSLAYYKELLVNRLQQKTEGFKYTELEKKGDEMAGHLIFKCESDAILGSDAKESQIYFLTKGKHFFFVNIIALKTSSLPKDFVEEWFNIFKQSNFLE
jgi:hypothetical protein